MANATLTGWLDEYRVPIYQVTDTIIAKSGSAIDDDLAEEGFGAVEGTIEGAVVPRSGIGRRRAIVVTPWR